MVIFEPESFHKASPRGREVARGLRRSQTQGEAILWHSLRIHKMMGRKFLRQHPILVEIPGKETFFVADFYCAASKLVVELGGKIHESQVERDGLRDEVLAGYGYRVLRLKNEEVEINIEAVHRKIRAALNSPPVPLSSLKRGGRRG